MLIESNGTYFLEVRAKLCKVAYVDICPACIYTRGELPLAGQPPLGDMCLYDGYYNIVQLKLLNLTTSLPRYGASFSRFAASKSSYKAPIGTLQVFLGSLYVRFFIGPRLAARPPRYAASLPRLAARPGFQGLQFTGLTGKAS